MSAVMIARSIALATRWREIDPRSCDCYGLARLVSSLDDGSRGRCVGDLGVVSSLSEAEERALLVTVEHPDLVTPTERELAADMTLVARFGEIEGRCAMRDLVASGSPAQAGSWAFQRVTR